MYHVFAQTLRTDKGKQLVRKYQTNFDAQQIYYELKLACTTSTKADTSATDKLTWLTSAKLTSDSWPGTHESFILHWQEQVRQYLSLAPTQQMGNVQLRVLLENAVSFVPYLAQVKDTSRLANQLPSVATLVSLSLPHNVMTPYDSLNLSTFLSLLEKPILPILLLV